MIYRALGVVSLAIGGVFALVALLVLLPFIDNFNMSLLVLCGVFGILAYVFLAIGWQLFHPPAGRAKELDEEVAGAGAESTTSRPVVPAGSDDGGTRPGGITTEAAATPSVPSAEGGFRHDTGHDTGDIPASTPAPASAPRASSNGGNADEAHSAAGGFRKPGAPVPHK